MALIVFLRNSHSILGHLRVHIYEVRRNHRYLLVTQLEGIALNGRKLLRQAHRTPERVLELAQLRRLNDVAVTVDIQMLIREDHGQLLSAAVRVRRALHLLALVVWVVVQWRCLRREAIDRTAKLIENHVVIAKLTAALAAMTLAVFANEARRVAAAVLGVVHRATGDACERRLSVVQVADLINVFDG